MAENEIAKIVEDIAATSLVFSIFAPLRLCGFASTDVGVVGPLCPSWNPDLLLCQVMRKAARDRELNNFPKSRPLAQHNTPGCGVSLGGYLILDPRRS
jgi:hypothetical protein